MACILYDRMQNIKKIFDNVDIKNKFIKEHLTNKMSNLQQKREKIIKKNLTTQSSSSNCCCWTSDGILPVSSGGTGTNYFQSNKFIQGNGTDPLEDHKDVPVGDVVGTLDAQTLTNKTINGTENSLSNIDATAIATGQINNTEFNSLIGIRSNIQQQIDNISFNTPITISSINLFSTTSTFFSTISSMQYTPLVGTYFILFSAAMSYSNINVTYSFAIYIDNAIVADTLRNFTISAGNNILQNGINIQLVHTFTGAETVYVKCKTSNNLHPITITNRSLILINT